MYKSVFLLEFGIWEFYVREIYVLSQKKIKKIYFGSLKKNNGILKRKNKQESKLFFKALRIHSFIHLIFNKDLCFAAMV